jgi:flagellar assembly protein FliH
MSTRVEEKNVSAILFKSIETPKEAEGEGRSQNEIQQEKQIVALNLQIYTKEAAMAAQLEDACRRTREETLSELQREYDEKLATEKIAVSAISVEFANERSRYFAAVEIEVVRLSLAIAARILHREAQIEPLILAGAVRVALEKIQGNSEGILRVPEMEVEAWRNRFSDVNMFLTVVSDQHVKPGNCLLETPVGTVNFGVQVQLAEIERGFFDLLQYRPS